MRKFILVLALLVLINVAWGEIPDKDKITSSNGVMRSGLFDKNLNNNLATAHNEGISKNDGQHTKIIRGSFDLDPNTIPLTQEDLDPKVRSFLSNNVDRFGIEQENLVLFSSYIGKNEDEQSVLKYTQKFKGLDIYSSKVIVVIKNNKVITVKSDYYPGIKIGTQPIISKKDILNVVETDLGIRINSEQRSLNIQDIQKQTANTREKKTRLESSSLVIYPEITNAGIKYHLAYELELELIRSPPAKWVYVVDADNGAILSKYNKVVFNTLGGKITGSIFPEGPGQSPVSKNIRNETLYSSQSYSSNTFWSGTGNNIYNYIVSKNPVDLNGVTWATLEFKTKYFIEEGYDIGYVTYSLDGQNFYFIETYSGNKSNWSTRRISLSDLTGNQIWIGFFYETDSVDSYDGWYLDNITIQTSSGTKLLDNADNFANWDNSGFSVVQRNLENHIALGNSRIDGSYNLSGLPGSFKMYTDLSGPFADIFNLLGNDEYHTATINTPATHDINWGVYDVSYKKEQSNVFYHVNIVHDYFTKGSPFNIYEMNYQTMADVQFPPFSPGECNAFADGTNVHFFGAGDGCDATSLFSDIIYHEYTHNVVAHVYTTDLPYREESGALNEGWADYFASTINGNSCMAEGFYGDCLRDLNNTYKYPEDILGEVHDDSRIVAGASWDLRQTTGAVVSDALVINAMKLEPFNFSEYLDDIIYSDDNNANLEDGTPHLFEICTAFYRNHGIYSSYCDRYYPVQKTSNIILNPGFEKGNVDWIQNSFGGYDVIFNDAYGSHYGSWFAYMGDYNEADDFIYQDITIPPEEYQPYIQFWYWIFTEETTTTNPYDTMVVEIRKTDDTLLKTLDTLSNLDQTYGYVISPKYDVSEFKGQKIRLKFHSTTDMSASTGFLVDDTGLLVLEKPPSGITFISPTPANNSIVRKNWITVNITANEPLTLALLEWNGVNESMSGGGNNWHKDKTGLADGIYNFRVYGQNNSGSWIKSEMRTVTISTVPSVLIIDDDNDIHFDDDQSISEFRSAFEGLGYKVKIENATETSDLTWNNYDIIVWSSADDATPLNDAQYKTMLVNFVNNGGHLILESGHIASFIKQHGGDAIDREFQQKVLHVTTDWVNSDVGDLTLSNSHPISAGLPDTIGFTPNDPGDDSPDADAVRILPDATGVYNWSYVLYGGVPIDENIAKISFGLVAYDDDSDVANGGQIVYYAFDIDDINSPENIQALIRNSVKWLGEYLPGNPTISVKPGYLNASANTNISVDIVADPNGKYVFGAEYKLHFDANKLEALNQINGTFLTQDGNSSIIIINSIDNVAGLLEYGEVRKETNTGINKSGILATIKFHVKANAAEGETILNVSDVLLTDPSPAPIPDVIEQDGVVNITMKSPPIAICGPDKLKCENVNASVQFNGSASYDPDGIIVSYAWEFGDGSTGTGIDPKHAYKTYRWNGTAYQPFMANLTVIDNSGLTNKASQKVVIWIAGEANGDGKVNILDASVVGLKWNSNPADPCADLNNDGKVNILDASIIGLNWGKVPQIQ